MKKAEGVIILRLLLLFMLHAEGTSFRPPGKPTLTSCRSPEKETFTCWWEPGSDGGLPTTYALYYRKENSETVYECPDYRTAGKNSCFFNKNITSIWINYNITVVATNALGSTVSDPVDVDVVYIVMPYPPESLTVTVLGNNTWPFLRVSWEPPQQADTRSGWITLVYELRIKLEGEDEWEVHTAGQQKVFNIYGLRSGGTYLVQVRCKPDHGFWSEWSPSKSVSFPEYFHRETSMWILIVIFCSFVILILTWVIHIKSPKSLKHCILPPVPGPKIKGFDKQLLKNGKCGDIFSSLVEFDSPPTATIYEDLPVEYLEVYIPEEQELMLEENKDSQDGSFKSEISASDSDSGRGSCDSHNLLIDKCEEKEDGQQSDQQGSEMETKLKRCEEALDEKPVISPHGNGGLSETSSVKGTIQPSFLSPLPQYSVSPGPLDQLTSLELAKQHCLSESLFPTAPLSSHIAQSGHSTKDGLGSSYWEFSFSNMQPHLLHHQVDVHQQLQAHGSVSNISQLQLPTVRSTDYVEVQRVSDQNMVLLHPIPSHPESSYNDMCQTEDYSRVKGVNNDNGLLLLQGEIMEEDMDTCSHEGQQTSGLAESSYTTYTTTSPQKTTVCIQAALPVQDERASSTSGYVDTSMFSMSTH